MTDASINHVKLSFGPKRLAYQKLKADTEQKLFNI